MARAETTRVVAQIFWDFAAEYQRKQHKANEYNEHRVIWTCGFVPICKKSHKNNQNLQDGEETA
jgi:hypothetical protein